MPPGRPGLPKAYHIAKKAAIEARAAALKQKAALTAEGRHEEAAAVSIPPSTLDAEVKEKLLAEAKEAQRVARRASWQKWYNEHREDATALRRERYDPEARRAYREENREKIKASEKARALQKQIDALKALQETAPEHWKEAILGTMQAHAAGTVTTQMVKALIALVKADSPEVADATAAALSSN